MIPLATEYSPSTLVSFFLVFFLLFMPVFACVCLCDYILSLYLCCVLILITIYSYSTLSCEHLPTLLFASMVLLVVKCNYSVICFTIYITIDT